MADYLNIAGRIRTTASDGVAMEAQEVKDITINKSQQEINSDVQTELGDRYTKEETYSKEQVNDLITTPDVNYVSVVATNLTTAVTDLLPATGAADTIYRVGNWDGTQYDTTMYSLYAWNGSAYVCLAVRSFVGEVYDISANHPDGQGDPTPYADLTAALGTSGANIPSGIRRGGMSIKFIQQSYAVTKSTSSTQPSGTLLTTDPGIGSGTYTSAQLSAFSTLPSDATPVVYYMSDGEETPTYTIWSIARSSDNKYVQCRLTADEWSIDTEDWAIVEEGVYVENPEFVYVKTDNENKILWAIKTDGSIYYGAGVPQQVVDYIQEQIAALSLDEYEDIVTFLGNLIYGNTLSTLLNAKANTSDVTAALDAKVDKITDKSLIDSGVASSQSTIENPEFLEIKTDNEDEILETITVDGRKQINIPIDIPSASVDSIENPEWLEVTTDSNGKILEGIKKDGSKYINKIDGLNEQIKEQVDESVNEAIAVVEQEISEVKDVIEYDERELIPDYYFANDYLDNKVDFIRNLMEGCMANGDAFFFQTDEHWELNAQHSPALIKYIADRLNISRLFDGGDSTHEIANYRLPHLNPAAIDFNRLRYKTYNGKIIHAVGNHEYLTAGYSNEHQFDDVDFNNWIDAAYFNSRDYDGAKFGDSASHYYYIDNEQKKIRYIVLASFKQKSTPIIGGDNKYYSIAEIDYNNEQLSWFTNTALNVEAGWTILVFTHFFWALGRGELDGEGYIETISPYISATIKPYGRAMLQYEGNGEIAAVFMGHEHTDGIYTIDDASVDLSGGSATGKSIPCICTTCDAYNFDLWEGQKLYNRTVDTITEQAFDVVILDKTQKKFTLVRIGAPAYDVLIPAPNGKYPMFGDLEYREINY